MKFAAVLLASLSATSAFADPTLQSKPPVMLASTCFKAGEQTSGMNKICYYTCLSGEVAITVPFVELCPISIDR
jgi:hypothetical protein